MTSRKETTKKLKCTVKVLGYFLIMVTLLHNDSFNM